MSALGADPNSPALYARTKAAGEAAVLAAAPDATIFRPSIVFGPEDDFFNRFAAMARMSPALPLIGGGETKFQPVFVGDVAQAIAARGRRRGEGRHDLRARRAGGEELPGADGIRARRHRAAPPAGAAAVRARQAAGASSCSSCRRRCSRRTRSSCCARDNVVSEAASDEGRTLEASASSRPRWRRSCRAICGASARPASSARQGGVAPTLPEQPQPDQPERADDDAPPGEQREAVARDVVEQRSSPRRTRRRTT